jgi:CelD/BcsL family acetyltransferase involved in cellulose biosynthesis
MQALRPLWERLYGEGEYTIFQSYEWNLIAAQFFAGREEPLIVAAQNDSSAAIIPAVQVRECDSLGLLGEVLFDYRQPLWAGEPIALSSAWAQLAEVNQGVSSSHVLEDSRGAWASFTLITATKAPCISRDDGFKPHSRLIRNLQRLERAGCCIKSYSGRSSQQILRKIYERKAQQPLGDLFADPLRVAAICAMAFAAGELCEVFTLESGSSLAAALVTFLDGGWRRFYTVYFNPEWARHSPGLTLIHHVCQLTLAQGLDCDFMTGEQGYKLRLAHNAKQLYRAEATPEQLAGMPESMQALEAA